MQLIADIKNLLIPSLEEALKNVVKYCFNLGKEYDLEQKGKNSPARKVELEQKEQELFLDLRHATEFQAEAQRKLASASEAKPKISEYDLKNLERKVEEENEKVKRINNAIEKVRAGFDPGSMYLRS